MELHLHPEQVKNMIKEAERQNEVIVIRCKRKTAASKPGGPDKGDYFDLHCAQKPADYVPTGTRDRAAEDDSNGVLTVFVTNRQDERTHRWGAFRRVNIEQVSKVTYRNVDYAITTSH